MVMLSAYPNEVVLRDSTKVTLRPMGKEDGDKLFRFFSELPDEDRLYLRDDVSKRSVIEAWIRGLDYDRVFPLMAEVHGRIVGDATLHRREHGWARHLGNVRVTIAKDFQKKGLGSKMVEELIKVASGEGRRKIMAEIIADQAVALRAFEKMGFQRVATLPALVKDVEGKPHDLAVLVYDIAAEAEMFDELF